MPIDADYSGPLFKRLTSTDAGTGDAHVSGPTLLEGIRGFFPRPAGPKSGTPLKVQLVDETATGREVLEPGGPAMVQMQGSGGKSTETILSHIGALRERCEEGDTMLFEPSLSDPELFRVTRVGKGSPRYAAIAEAIGETRAGLLPGGLLPRDRIGGRLRPAGPDGELVHGEFSVEGSGREFEITFESGDGKGRNSRYRRAVALVLSRLASAGATMVAARIASSKLLKSNAVPAFDLRDYPFPLVLSEVKSFEKLSKALGTAGGKVDSPPDRSGSNTRRMTLQVRLAVPGMGLHALEEHLAGCRVPPRATTEAAEPLALLADLKEIDAAWGIWLKALEAASRPKAGSLRWMDGPAVMYAVRPSAKRDGARDVQLGVHATGKLWAVEINAPRAAADANGLASVARNAAGDRFLLRQGWLQANPDSDGDVRDPAFGTLAGLSPVPVTGGSTPLERTWYVVASLDRAPQIVAAETADFVLRCAQARAATRPDAPAPLPASPALFAGAEVGGVFVKQAVAAQPETTVLRIQGEVWLALSAMLEAAGRSLDKIRHQAGYEVDGVVDGPEGPILLEIKTGSSAADVYEGVGQLMLYSQMLGLHGHRKLLLLGFEPSTTLMAAAAAFDIGVFRYTLEGPTEAPSIAFDEDFLRICGAAA